MLKINVCFLGAFPGAADIITDEFCLWAMASWYPLHLACRNASCQGSVIDRVSWIILMKQDCRSIIISRGRPMWISIPSKYW